VRAGIPNPTAIDTAGHTVMADDGIIPVVDRS
jgi:hypothetical protein